MISNRGKYSLLVTRINALLALFLFLGFAHVTYAQNLQQEHGLPPLTFDEKEVFELEQLSRTDLDTAKKRAKTLKAAIENQLSPYREFADKKNDQARQYRDLADSNDENAKANWERAKKYKKEAKDPIFKDNKRFRDLMKESARQSERDAKADEESAKAYRKKAKDLDQEAEEFFDEMEVAKELIKRLDAIINKEEEKPKEDPEVSNISPDSNSDTKAPDLKFELEDVIGLWRYTKEDAGLFAIVNRWPGTPEDADDAYLEAHTDSRKWTGAMYAKMSEDDPLLEFTYKPTADEMNGNIPEWVRLQIEGKLEWKLAIDEAGSVLEPKLRVKFFPGEIQWKEDGNSKNKGSVKIVGEGLPRVFELEPITSVSIKDLSQERIYLSLGGNHDPDVDPVQALIKRQSFTIKVSLPADVAKKAGTKITAKIKGLSGNNEDTLELRGAKPVGQRPVVYSNTKAVYIADCDVFGDQRRNPQVMSLSWIFGSEGDCLDIDTKNEEIVEFSYGEAYHRIIMFDSWVQRGIKRHQQGFDRLRGMLGQVLTSNKPYEVKEAARKRLKMINNYEALASSGQLTDVHIFHIGEEYLGDVMGAGLIYIKESDLNQNYKDANSPRRWLSSRNDNTDPNYFNNHVKAFLEGLSGKELTPDAHKAGDDIAWTSEAEKYFIIKTIKETSASYASKVVKSYAKNFSLGLYDGLVTSTGASDYYLVLTGRDHMKNKKQPFWMRLNVAIGLASNTMLSISSSNLAHKFMASSPPRKTLGKISRTESAIAARGSSGVVKGTKIDDIVQTPESLSPAQKKQTTLELTDTPGGEGGPPCMSRVQSKATSRMIKNFEEMSLEDLVESYSIDNYIARHYPEGTKIIDPFSKKIFDTQVGPSCNMMSVNYSVNKRTGKRITQQKGHNTIFNIMWEEAQAGKRDLSELFSGPGINHGYDQKAIRRYLRSQGARVAEIPPLLNRNVKLRHIWALLEQGWDVKAILNFGKQAGQHNYHAVIVDGLVVNPKTKTVNAVRVYDPNVGRLMTVPAAGFKDLLARGTPYGTITAFRWD